MSAQGVLTNAVAGWERRRRWTVVVENLPRAMLPGVMLGTALAMYARWRPGPEDTVSVTVALGGAALGVIVLLAWVWLIQRRSAVDSARWFDLRFGLMERVSTALELIDGSIKADEGLSGHQLEDAQQAANRVKAAAYLPFYVDRRAWVMVGTLLALLAFLVMLTPRASGSDADRLRERAAIDAAAEQVGEILQDIAADPALTDEQRGPLLEALQAQLETLRDPNLSLDEALATLGEVESMLSEQADALEEQIGQQEQAEAEANAAIERLSPDVTGQSLQQNLESLQSGLEDMTAEQMEQAAQAFEQAADALESTNPQAADALRQAAEALRNGDPEAARDALRQAAAAAAQADSERGEQRRQAQTMQSAAEQADAAQEQAAQEGGTPIEAEAQNTQGEGQEGGEGAGMFGQVPSEGMTEAEGEGSAFTQADDATRGDTGQSGLRGRGGDGAGDGRGDLSEDASAQPQERDPDRDTTENNPDGRGERDYQAVFAPRFSVEAEGDDELRLNADPGDTPLEEGEFQENPVGVSVVPYNQVFSDYADAASRALESDYIPLGLRDVIRDYFSSLEPQQP